MRGCFKLLNERGLPLEILLEALEKNNSVVDWNDLIQAALASGWTPQGLLARIEEAVYDVYEFSREEILMRARYLTAQVVCELIQEKADESN